MAWYDQLAYTLSGGAVGSGGQVGGTGRGPSVTTGPLTLGPGQTALPYFSQARDSITYGSGSSARTVGASRISRSPYFNTRSVENASQEFFQREPGSEVISYAPGSADLLRTLYEGFLPTLRPQGQVPASSEASGFAQGATGVPASGIGGDSPVKLLAIGAAVVVGLFLFLRK